MEEQYPVMVTIECCVYNHEPYLRQCLDGFIMQKTNFPFEAIVHDDASTDGSAAIIMEYAEKYPDIIKPIIEKENQYSKGNGILRKYLDTLLKGKYIALCEGDDYWTDSSKLQKQFDFMEKNPDYSLCFHAIKEIWHDKRVKDRIRMTVENRDYTGVEWFKKRPSQMASFFYRKDVVDTDLYKDVIYKRLISFPVGDLPLLLCCSKIGKLRGMSDVMSVYRHHEGGWTQSAKSKESFWPVIYSQLDYKFFGAEYEPAANYFYQHDCISAFTFFLKKRKWEGDFLLASLKISVWGTIHAFYRVLTKRYRY